MGGTHLDAPQDGKTETGCRSLGCRNGELSQAGGLASEPLAGVLCTDGTAASKTSGKPSRTGGLDHTVQYIGHSLARSGEMELQQMGLPGKATERTFKTEQS